jgi:hypothetical protein|nr:hypothetical protein [Mucilaginibacter sp. X4EP1]
MFILPKNHLFKRVLTRYYIKFYNYNENAREGMMTNFMCEIEIAKIRAKHIHTQSNRLQRPFIFSIGLNHSLKKISGAFLKDTRDSMSL